MSERAKAPLPPQAHDRMVRSLSPAPAALRGLAERLGCELYDGRRAAAEAGLALPLEPRAMARRLPFL